VFFKKGLIFRKKNEEKIFFEDLRRGALFFFFGFGGGGGGCVKVKSSQAPDMFPKKFQMVLHFYPICFEKCCPPFTYIGRPKGRNFNYTSRNNFLF